MKTYLKKQLTALLRPIVEPLVKAQVKAELAKADQANPEEFAKTVRDVFVDALSNADFS